MRRARLLMALVAAAFSCLSFSCVVEERKYDAEYEAELKLAAEKKKKSEEPEDSGIAADKNSELCQDYCSSAMKNCTGEYAVYASPEACLAVCAQLPAGEKSDEEGANTVACRLEQAKLAGLTREPEVHCPSAGPGGNDQGTGLGCGSNCESYCLLQPKICGDIDDEPVFEAKECQRRCAALPNEKNFDVKVHHDGNNVQCRLVHLSSAAIDSRAAETHCWHARISPKQDSPCGNPTDVTPSCKQYCDVVANACSGARAVYESTAECMAACKTFEPGTHEDTVENTLGCRLYHAYSSLDAPKLHCPHAGPSGDGHCGGDNCETYCPLIEAACPEAYAAEFPATSDCLEACALLEGAEKDQGYALESPSDGDNVQCRIRYAVKALKNDRECVSAMGGGSCK